MSARVRPRLRVGLLVALIVATAGGLLWTTALQATGALDASDADVAVSGATAEDRAGAAVASGDINGDGTTDLLVGAWGFDPGGGIDAGATYVLYGGGALPASIDLLSASADLTVLGDNAGDNSGIALASGDINGDGTDDLIIGALGASPGGRGLAGATYVIYGGGSLPAAVDLNETSADLTVYGDNAADNSGRAVAAGDVNGDGIDDLIIGAWGASVEDRPRVGVAHLIYGRAGLPATIDLDASASDVTIVGATDHSSFAISVAAGDVNGDGVDDMILGAHGVDTPGGGDAGATYVIYGEEGLPAMIDLADTAADVTILGHDPEGRHGRAVAVGDINGDGIVDLIHSAWASDPGGRSSAGEVYVTYGGANLPATIDLSSTSADLTIYGDDAGDGLGIFTAAGDVNGDGVDDLILGARYASPAGLTRAGTVYVIYGGEDLPSLIDLSLDTADLTLLGDTAQGGLGVSVAAGDINNDGTDDVIAGAHGANPAGRTRAGIAYLMYGGNAPVKPALIGDANCDETVTSVDGALVLQFVAGLLGSVACGNLADANGDGGITAVDATLILQLSAGLLTSLPP